MPALLLIMLMVLAPLTLEAQKPKPTSAKDSAQTLEKLREKGFAYAMDWRYNWWQFMAEENIRIKRDPNKDSLPGYRVGKGPTGTCTTMSQWDVKPNELAGHYIPDTMHANRMLCPTFSVPRARVVDTRLFLEARMDPRHQAEARKLRAPLIAALDSGAARYPGDAWIAGQRVRLKVDHQDLTGAAAAASDAECKAQRWWCLMLRGYVSYMARDVAGAERAFDAGTTEMPRSVWCTYNNLSELFLFTGRTAYQSLSCGAWEQPIWWLSDPLYTEPGNERKVEHFGRMMAAELRAANIADGIYDWRIYYDSLNTRELVKRYGFPGVVEATGGFQPTKGNNPTVSARTAQQSPGMARILDWNYAPVPVQKWRDRNTKSLFFGAPHTTMFIGPQYHTVPSWRAVQDPLKASDSDWDLGPEIYDEVNWDESWWAPEFYERDAGPLFTLHTQTALFRRPETVMLAANSAWETEFHFRAPPQPMLGVATSFSAAVPPVIVRDAKAVQERRGLLVPVPSRPFMLGVEITSGVEQGAAGRTRFGVTPPQPLSALRAGELALSDIVLLSATRDQPEPRDMNDVVARMLPATRLNDPTRLAIAWESYGQRDGDTLDVGIRVVRKPDQGLVARVVGAVTPGTTEDSLVVHSRDPMPADLPASMMGTVPVRLRSRTLEVSRLSDGDYSLEVVLRRGAAVLATSKRDLTIKR